MEGDITKRGVNTGWGKISRMGVGRFLHEENPKGMMWSTERIH